MANPYIRPISNNYHDFTEKKVVEPDDEVPLKFRGLQQGSYVKKPPKKQPPQAP